MKAIFVAGTDTGVGKSVVTGLLARYLSERGYTVITQKWVQTGCASGLSSDIKLHLKIMGKDTSQIKDYLSYVSPYTFKLACSPHLASEIENRRIHIPKIIKSFRVLCHQFDFVIVEGIGGILVPLNKKRLVIDLVRSLGLSVLLVAQNKLGAINHTLLTIENLNARKINILGIVFNNPQKEKRQILKDNPRIIKTFTAEKIFGILPWRETDHKLYEKFIPIADRIWKRLVYG